MSSTLVHGEWNEQATVASPSWALSGCDVIVLPVSAVATVVVAIVISVNLVVVSAVAVVIVSCFGVNSSVLCVGEFSDSCMIFCRLLFGVVCVSSSVSDACC